MDSRRVRVLAAAVLAMLACGGRGGWDLRSLEERHPALREIGGHRLADALPYFAPDSRGAVLFLCRWSTEAPIRVHLDEGLSESERSLVRKAIQAWEGAGLGLQFRAVPRDAAELEIEFLAEDPEAGPRTRSGGTVADCAISGDFDRTPDAGPVPADLVHASIQMRRGTQNLIGEFVPLSEEELFGALLHELGHALGYPSHPTRGSSVMTSNVDEVRRIGRRVLAGDRFRDATLAALYAVPSGTSVGRLEISEDRHDELVRLSALASAAGWRGPYVRVGDRSARLFWREPDGGQARLTVDDWAQALHTADALRLQPNARVHRLLQPPVASDSD